MRALLLAALVGLGPAPGPDELIRRAEADRRRGDLKGALAVLDEALAAARRDGDARAEGSALYLAGQIRAQAGAHAEALASLSAAQDLGVRLEDPRLVATALGGQGIVHRHLGELETSLDRYREALFLAEGAGLLREQGRLLTNIAVVLGERGDLRGAQDALQEALALKERAGDTASLAVTLQNLAKLYALQGHPDLSIEYYRRGVAADAANPDRVRQALNLTNLGEALSHAGRRDEARQTLQEALSLARELPEIRASAEIVLGEVALDSGEAERAEAHAARALEAARVAREGRVLADAWTLLARARLLRGAGEPALAAATEAVAAADRVDVAWVRIEAHRAAAEAYRALGRNGEAERAFESAVALIERSRERVAGGEEDRQRFLGRHLAPYHALVDLAFSSGDAARGFSWAERARGRVVAEVLARGRAEVGASLTAAEAAEERAVDRRIRLAQTALDEAPEPEREAARDALERARGAREDLRARLYAAHPDVRLARGDAAPVAVDDAARLLDRRTAILAYTVADGHTWLMALTAGGDGRARTSLHRIAEGRESLRQHVQRFRDALGRRDLAVAAQARDLHRRLLSPAGHDLAGRSRLVIVPDGPLWELPFAALAPTAGRYLLDEAAVSYAPSVTALLGLAQRGRAGERRLLALGNPSPLDPPWAPLPEAERQVQALARLYGADRSHLLVGSEAREGAVKARSGDASILHFATHGQADDASPMYSSLVLAREPDDAREDGRLEARELIQLPLRADLAVLSACETGRGRVGRGEGIIGLSWALLVAGARNAVVSHWRVDARSTEELMVGLHRLLLQDAGGADVAEALRDAALAVRADPRYRHPFYWAGFSLLGGARLDPP